ncbi:hybrid sensor histidine kinase/response regulator [Salinimonas sediminis]|uniref:hybrid sensor histidine kinase/response regulator n=1 Tax=Salinimonas sediminis TaxID=2303538 RepID=UPI001E4547ED|nr:ATP-binding protein [Salinimonas sediminis]
MTPDTELPPSKLIPTTEESHRQPLDLTRSLLRTFSPIHLQYVRNQGQRATFSISLVTDGELYGLITCHNREPSYIPQNVRLQCENLSQLFSWHLKAKEEELARLRFEKTEQAVDAMLNRIGPSNPIGKVIKNAEGDFLEALDTHGFLYYSEYETITLGQHLPVELTKTIFSRARHNEGFPYVSDNLYEEWPETKQYGIAGIMIIPLFEKKKYFTAWFRKERPMKQKWVGAQEEVNEDSPKAKRLEPRTSFTVHERTITGHSKKFEKADINTAHRLNRMFLVYALEVQERMHISIKELEKQDQYRNEFLATLAHELRNPLGPIMSGASILETVDDEGTRKRVTSIINRQAEYMSKLINDLMDVSRITRGKVKLEFEKLNIHDVISESLEIVDQHVKAKHHTLDVQYLSEGATVFGDKARLSQVFSNIIHNAAKYTNEQGQININIKQEGSMVVVHISDNGMGIPQDRLKDVFNMFTQIEAHSTHTKGGLGIGLTLVSKLVALHHGSVDVTSSGEGKGSTFTVKLPIYELAFGDQESTEESDTNLSGKRIMFVDDNEDLVDMYCLLATTMGFETRGISVPRDAIDEFKNFKPHCVFLDIGMPDIDGYELCKILKALPGANMVKFYSQSGWGTDKYIESSKQAGFDDHFVKPLSKEIIKKVMD